MSLVLGGALRALSLGSHLSPFSLSYMRPREKRILLGSPALCTGADGSSPSWAPGPVAKASPSLLCVRGVAPHFIWCRGHSEKPHHWLASRAHQSPGGIRVTSFPPGVGPLPLPSRGAGGVHSLFSSPLLSPCRPPPPNCVLYTQCNEFVGAS